MSRVHPSRLLPAYKKLIHEGARAKAVVIAADDTGGMQAVGGFGVKMTLRVRFPDGQTAEFTREEQVSELKTTVSTGAVMPVRYDPADRSRIEIDLPALRAELAAGQDERSRQRIAEAEARLQAESDGD